MKYLKPILVFTSNSLFSVIPPSYGLNAYADSGATNTYFRLSGVHNRKIKTNNPGNVQHTGGKYIKSIHKTTLDLPMLDNENVIGHVLPQLKVVSLLSIYQLCDNECTTYFNKKYVYIIKNKNTILQGSRDTSNGIWKILVPIKKNPNSSTI